MTKPVHIIFIHGLSNKPPKGDLRRIWLEALAKDSNGNKGFDLASEGVSDSFVYWADLFNDSPMSASDYESRNDELEQETAEVDLNINEWVSKMQIYYPDVEEDYDEPKFDDLSVDNEESHYEAIPIPWFLKKRIMRQLVKEAHDYLFNVNDVRNVILSRVIDEINKLPVETECVLVGHSLGSVITYDILTSKVECKSIKGMMTIGSPLGLDEIQYKLEWTRDNGFPKKLKGDWFNVYDSFDVVSRPDPKLSNDFKKNGAEVVIDINEQNSGYWRHSATKYFEGPKLRRCLRLLCNREV